MSSYTILPVLFCTLGLTAVFTIGYVLRRAHLSKSPQGGGAFITLLIICFSLVAATGLACYEYWGSQNSRIDLSHAICVIAASKKVINSNTPDADYSIYYGQSKVGAGKEYSYLKGDEDFCITMPYAENSLTEFLKSLTKEYGQTWKLLSKPERQELGNSEFHSSYYYNIEAELKDGTLDSFMAVFFVVEKNKRIKKASQVYAIPIRVRSKMGQLCSGASYSHGTGNSATHLGIFSFPYIENASLNSEFTISTKDAPTGKKVWMDSWAK